MSRGRHFADASAHVPDLPDHFPDPPTTLTVNTGTGWSGRPPLLDEVWVHPDYNDTTRSEDIGLIAIDGTFPVGFEFVPHEHTDAISIGQPVARPSFPGELGVGKAEGNGRVTPRSRHHQRDEGD